MRTLALERRLLAWAATPLLLLAACADDTVPPADGTGQTETETETETSPTTGSTSAPLDSTSSETETTHGTTVTTAPPPTTDGGSTDPLPSVCGNNIVEGDEVCDLAQVNGETCESLGYQGGQLGCLLTCEDYNLLGCFICGNEIIDIAEDCEGSVPANVTCQSLGFQDGFITCGNDCLYDISECSICGDGLQSGYEQCDGIDFGGQTCATVGFEGGNLACNLAQCAFVYSGCFGGAYFQDFEPSGSLPIEFTAGVVAPWTVSSNMPINGNRSARSGSLPAGGITDLTLQASFAAAGTVSFFHREETAAGWDFLQFYRNGVVQQTWSGVNAAAQYNAPVPAGNHTFVWRFERAGFVDAGQNAVWIDDITLEGGVPQ
jgi:hypothetical protein